VLDPLRRGVAEFIGTLTLIFVGALAFLVTRRLAGARGRLLVRAVLRRRDRSTALKWIFPTASVDGKKLGVPQLNATNGSGAGVATELILTFFIVWVVFATAADPRGTFKSIAGLAIGFTISLDILM